MSDFCRNCGAGIPPKSGEGTCLRCDPVKCPHCQNDNELLVEKIRNFWWHCVVCTKTFEVKRG